MSNTDSTPRIVVGVDGSPSSQAALRWAVGHARIAGGVVDAVCAWDLPGMQDWSAPPVDTDLDQENARKAFAAEMRDVLGEERTVEVREHVVRGNPAEVLLAAADGADVLVVGSRGRGGFARLLLGSVSQQCALHATCPVVIVRPDH
ncbi:universal stress protein [Streptomyces sp. AM8-1-1]|uniref:universal stress protein n=1 Tax=Streptomyces sp. AM8-1-1 TaxID=3075825 RepID=UPI0028C3C54F|nr:universal stress protein [Streptomyces sp. AM8-1-1]WNO70287.1 universal stress protein [Streptomyces sp. AM8-1-1]